jgi:Rieske Fe-S protein
MEEIMQEMKRREFLKTGATTVIVASTCLCGLNGCATFTKVGDTLSIKPEALTRKDHELLIDLSKEPVLRQVGNAVKIKNEWIPQGVIIAHTEENTYHIVSLSCTHRGAEVEYDHQNRRFVCASLGSSKYSLEGQLMKGPAKKSLQPFTATLQDGILSIKITKS